MSNRRDGSPDTAGPTQPPSSLTTIATVRRLDVLAPTGWGGAGAGAGQKKTPDNPGDWSGVVGEGALQRLPAQLIGKLRNPARRWRRPSALEQDRLALPGPNRHRGCRRWKQRSAYRC